MVVIDMSTMKPAVKQDAPVLLRIQQGENWKSEATMSEEEALCIAAECRKRGLSASVVAHG